MGNIKFGHLENINSCSMVDKAFHKGEQVKKEITVWAVLNWDKSAPLRLQWTADEEYMKKSGTNWTECILSFEIPDKKAEITESQLMEMASDFIVHQEIKNGPLIGSYKEPVSKWKEKLFGAS